MSQKLKKGYVYCFKEKQGIHTSYLLQCSNKTTSKDALQDIETKYPDLKGKLSSFHGIKVSNTEESERLLNEELGKLSDYGVIDLDDVQTHKLRLIKSKQSSLETILKKLMDRYQEPKNNNAKSHKADSNDLTVIVLILLGLAFLSSIVTNTEYEACIQGGGGNACEKLVE